MSGIVDSAIRIALAGAAASLLSGANYVCVTEKVVVPQDAFISGQVVQLARQRLPVEANWDLLVVEYRSTATSRPVLGVADETYASWNARRALSLAHDREPIGQMIATKKGAMVRISLRDGAIRRVMLQGSDPLHFDVDGKLFEALDIDPSRNRVLVVGRLESEAEARTVAQQAYEVLPADPLTVLIRPTPWFIPAARPEFPFFPNTATPSHAAWRKEREFICMVKGIGVSCTSLTGSDYETLADRLPIDPPSSGNSGRGNRK